VPEFSDREDIERWLVGKPREWAIMLAARAALRVVPALVTALTPRARAIANTPVFLPTFLGGRGGGIAELGRVLILPSRPALSPAKPPGFMQKDLAKVSLPQRRNTDQATARRRSSGCAGLPLEAVPPMRLSRRCYKNSRRHLPGSSVY
jgi:hypothetical protein